MSTASCRAKDDKARSFWWRVMRTIFFFAVQLLLLTGFANAQSAANVVAEFGLFGTWAIDCRQPPSPANAYANFSLTSQGAIELRDDFAPAFYHTIYRIFHP